MPYSTTYSRRRNKPVSAGRPLLCPYCRVGQVWSSDEGAECVNPDPDAGGAPGCGATWDAVGSPVTIVLVQRKEHYGY